MRVYEGKDIRNVTIAGHSHCGKTSLVAGMLYAKGATNRLTRVDEGNTITDYDDEEKERKLTIATAIAYVEHDKSKVNLLDTPGFSLFVHEAKAAMAASDAALIVVDATSGVEVMTEKVWSYADEFNLPRVIVVNKMDRDLASFDRTLASIHEAFGRRAVAIQMPIGSEKDFRGVVNLIRMKAYLYEPGGDGKGKETEIPADMKEAADAAHEALIEMVAEGDDHLMEIFFEKGTLPEDTIIEGIIEELPNRQIIPVLCSSASTNIGLDRIIDFCVRYFPPPTAHAGFPAESNGKPVERKVSDSEPVSAFVFKTISDPFAGHVSYFKLMSGVLQNDQHLINSRNSADERLAHIGCPFGNHIEHAPRLHAGDIGAVAKLKDTLTWDTLAEKGSPISYPPVTLPEPSISFAVEPASRHDEDRLGTAIHKVLEEDPVLRFYRDPQTKEFLVAGTGSQHVEIAVSKLKRRYNVDVNLKEPKIPYRETIRGMADVQGRHKKQTGGHGQFGDCKIRMSPLERGQQFEFVNSIFGGSIPRQYIPAVEKGILEAAQNGFLAGYPVVDFKVELYDGSYHDVDSSELAFKLAGRKAFRSAMGQASPALLEPVMKVEIVAPTDYAGDLMGDLNGRRGRISGMDVKGGNQIIRAFVPMSEMLTYQNDLISMTQGRASFSMEYDHYDYVPAHLADKIITQAKRDHGDVDADED